MSNLKRIEAVLSKLDKAANEAFKVLNEASNNAYEGSAAEADPTRHAHEIAVHLRDSVLELKATAHLEGLSSEEIEALKKSQKETGLERLQTESAEKLAALLKRDDPAVGDEQTEETEEQTEKTEGEPNEE